MEFITEVLKSLTLLLTHFPMGWLMTPEIPSQQFRAHSCHLYHKEHTELSALAHLKIFA